MEILDIGLAVDELPELALQRLNRIRDDGEAFVHRLASDLQRVCERPEPVRVDARAIVRVAQAREQLARVAAQLLRLFRGQHDQRRRARRRGRARGRRLPGRLLEDHVRVRAARAERGHAGDARMFAAVDHGPLPGPRLAVDDERRGRKVDVRIELARVQARHQQAVLHLQQHLGEPREAGGGLEMADVRLDRADRAEAAIGRIAPERARQPGDLDRIAELGAGAVRLDIAHRARVHAGAIERAANHVLLRDRVRHRVAVGLAAVVDAGRANRRVNAVAVRERARQRLEHDHADALARHIAVAAEAETLAAAVGRQHPLRAQAHVHVRMQRQVHAARERHLALAETQLVAGLVHGDER
ncbi:hypothetical protein DO62_6057 [Burkholderia pseudomallei]|nr:hypothetical protein DO62_6057 [Burkholderia pseudomallei]KGW37747.1 hypothetical protein Y602_6213 [Burkholderia pseudomallei MSHR733]